MAEIGPVQLLVVDVGDEPTGAVLAELQVLADLNVVRLLDLMVLRHHEDGQMEALEVSATPEGGAKVATLTGLHDGAHGGGPDPAVDEAHAEDMWYVADAIPPGKTVAIALLEHRWAIGLRDALQSQGGQLLAEAWVHPLDLVAIGLADPEE